MTAAPSFNRNPESSVLPAPELYTKLNAIPVNSRHMNACVHFIIRSTVCVFCSDSDLETEHIIFLSPIPNSSPK